MGWVQMAFMASMYSSVRLPRPLMGTSNTSNSLDSRVALEPSPTPTSSRPSHRWSRVAHCLAA